MNDIAQVSDLALDTFLATAKEYAPDLPTTLIEQVFLLQKNHQFDGNRDMSVQALQRAIEEYVTLLDKTKAVAL